MIFVENILWLYSKIFCLSGQNEYHTSKKDMDIFIKQEDATCPCFWIIKECFLWSVLKIYWFLKKILCLRGIVAYYYDIVTDILMTIKLWYNCHYYYAYVSISAMVFSTMSTLTNLAQLGNEDNQVVFVAFWLYPFTSIIMVWRKLIYGSEALSDKEELVLFKIKFTEAILEAIPELGLNLYILHHHGFDEEYFLFLSRRPSNSKYGWISVEYF